jgi:hypothetical protein
MNEDDPLLATLRELRSLAPPTGLRSEVATRAERAFLAAGRPRGAAWSYLGLMALLLGCEGVCIAHTLGLLVRVFG